MFRLLQAIFRLNIKLVYIYTNIHDTNNVYVYTLWVEYLSRCSDWLLAGRFGDRIPVGVRFFAHVQIGPGTHPASCTIGTGFIPGVKRPERGAEPPPPPGAEVENE
jgi:hypothetical protein